MIYIFCTSVMPPPSQVLGERQRQISEKMDMVRQQQEESLQRREELVQDLEMMQQMTRREQEEQDDLKTARKQELQAQVTETDIRSFTGMP